MAEFLGAESKSNGEWRTQFHAIGQNNRTGDSRLFGIWKDNKAVASVQDFVSAARKGRVG